MSSISIVMMDLADVFLMQNPQHPPSILAACNEIPKRTDATDFARVRDYFLSGESSRVRQVLLFSQIERPELRAWSLQFSQNANGQVLLAAEPPANGVLDRCFQPADHHFHAITHTDPKTVDEARFHFFQKTVIL